MKIFDNIEDLKTALQPSLDVTLDPIAIKDQQKLQEEGIDDLVHNAVFSQDDDTKKFARGLVREVASQLAIHSSSIQELYMAFGRGEVAGFTVPAMNVRAMTYDHAQIVFRLAKKMNAGSFIFEIARTEMQYTEQRPDEYAVVILAAAIKAGWVGPVFIQGDHFQFSKNKFGKDPASEAQAIKDLIKESLDAHFYNIDIDASTLVDLEKKELSEQQKNNYEVTAALTKYIREKEPSGVTVSIGGEIGHIGGVNSTVEDFEAFMKGYLPLIGNVSTISKVSVQTGTSHGGIPLPDGTIQKVNIDFKVLESVTAAARGKYHMGGAVQHGASTLPNELFGEFPKHNALEIHLATGFQNIVYENMPDMLKAEIYEWVKKNLKDEWEEGWNEEQFLYKCRKKAIGPFKKQLWQLSETEKKPIRDALESQLQLLFDKLKIENSYDSVVKYVK